MTKTIKIFENQEFGKIRTIVIEDKIYFSGKDVATALGYVDPKGAVSRHCKGALFQRLSDNQGIIRETKVIPEGDVYRLVIKSELPAAEKFEAWICDEVLPSIRKTGQYSIDKTPEELLLENVQLLVAQSKRLKSLEDKVEEIDKRALTAPNYFTVVGFAALKGIKVNLQEAISLGRKAVKICKELSININSVPDPRFGRVNTYPEEVLCEVFRL
jgi:prophage antirepressor-like protein